MGMPRSVRKYNKESKIFLIIFWRFTKVKSILTTIRPTYNLIEHLFMILLRCVNSVMHSRILRIWSVRIAESHSDHYFSFSCTWIFEPDSLVWYVYCSVQWSNHFEKMSKKIRASESNTFSWWDLSLSLVFRVIVCGGKIEIEKQIQSHLFDSTICNLFHSICFW